MKIGYNLESLYEEEVRGQGVKLGVACKAKSDLFKKYSQFIIVF